MDALNVSFRGKLEGVAPPAPRPPPTWKQEAVPR